jgi:hypothetical protein
MTDINTFCDTHCHIFSHRWINDDVYFGRHRVPGWAGSLLPMLRDAAKGLKSLIPDDIELAIETTVEAFHLDDDARRIAEIIGLFYMSPADQIERLRAMWRANGISGGYILIPAVGDYRRATREITAACAAYDDIKVFAPWQCADEPGVYGVKYYPALDGRACLPQVVGCHKPIIAHCSPGGIRKGQRSESAERADNAPGWVHDALALNPKARITLAHGGGERAFLRACNPKFDTPVKNLIRDHGGPGTEHPDAWIGVDTAFHEGVGLPWYKSPWMVTDATMIGHVLIGSDWPLHLPLYSYSTWARRARYTFGAGLDNIDAARVAFEGRE